ncbi:acyl-CoA carboxylase epsilon subunit [Agromyces bauzanensis]
MNAAGNHGAQPEPEADARAADLRFVTRGVTHEEAAAVTAVILAAIDEQSVEASVAEPPRDPWVQSGHALRSPITVGPGSWTRSVR